MVERSKDPMVHIRILQSNHALPNDSAVMGDKHTGSSDGLGEYGISRKFVANHNNEDHDGEEGDRCPKSNMEIQGKAIRLIRPNVQYLHTIASDQLDLS